MAEYNYTLKVDSNLKSILGDAKELNKELEKAAKLASSLTTGNTVSGGSPRSASQTKAVASASGGSGRSALDDSGLNRGTAGGNVRGDSRDFARQAQGLGGLVHVYATFAANLFAVSAAFNALSKAADFTNMVKGLDQLGAASGKNLGSLAKRMTEISDGAINMKEAMSAVAQGNAAGLTGEQMERMTKIAKTASQALGRDMGDALSRLSRGITKVEPELLDELGIMVKVDKAARDYALTLGKAATQLTDFEKKQSYAVAVLEEGERKFKAINIDANPYQKLLASFTNLALKGGELLNTVLGPIAKILAESPVALAAVMAGIGTMLVSKAIPALTQWREGVAKAANEAEANAKRISQNLANFKAERAGVEAGAHDKAADDARARAYQLAQDNKLFGDRSKTMYELAGASKTLETATSTTNNKISALSRSIEENNTKLNNSKNLSTQEREIIVAKIALLQKEKDRYLELAAAIRLSVEEREKGNKLEAQGGTLDFEGKRRQTQADLAVRKAAMQRIGSNVIDNARDKGIFHAWGQIAKDIEEYNTGIANSADKTGKQIGKLGSAFLHIKGAGQLALVAIDLVSDVIQKAAFYVTIAITAFEALDHFFSTSSKQAEAYATSLDTVKDALAGAQRTIDRINAIDDPLEKLSVDNVLAKVTALNELTSSMRSMIVDFEKLKASQSTWDKGLDAIKGWFGKDSKTKASMGIAEGIKKNLELIDNPETKETYKNSLRNIIGNADVEKLTTKELAKVIDPLQKGLKEGLTKAAQDVVTPIQQIKSGLDTLTQASKDFDAVIAGLAPTDSISKTYMNTLKGISDLTIGMDKAKDGMSSLNQVAGDFSKLKLFPTDTALAIVELGKKSKNTTEDLEAARDKVSKLKAELEDYNKNLKGSSNDFLGEGWEKEKLQQLKDAENTVISSLRSYSGEFITLLQEGAKASIAGFEEAVTKASSKAAIVISRAFLAGTEGQASIKAEAALKQQEIKIELDAQKQAVSMMISQEKLRLAIEKNTLTQEKETLSKNGQSIPAKLEQAILHIGDAQDTLEGATTYDTAKAKGLDQKSIADNPYLVNIYGMMKGYRVAEKDAGAKSKAVEIQKEVDLVKDLRAQELLGLTNAEKSLQSQQKIVSTIQQQAGISSEAIDRLKNEIDDRIYLNKLAQFDLKIRQEEDIYNTKVAEGMKGKALLAAQETKDRHIAQLQADRKLAVEDQVATVLIRQGEERRKALELALEMERISNVIKDNESRVAEAKESETRTMLDYYKQTNVITAQNYEQEILSLDIAKQKRDYEKDKRNLESSFKSDTKTEVLTIQSTEAQLKAMDSELKDHLELTAEQESKYSALKKLLADTNKLYDQKKKAHQSATAALEAENEAKTKGISITAKLKLADAELATTQKMFEKFGASLEAIFGETGKRISESFQSIAKAENTYIKESIALNEKYAQDKEAISKGDGSEFEKWTELSALEQKHVKKSEELETDKNIAVLSSFKKMFSEKTAAYKILDGIEKASHVMKMVQMAEEIGSWIAKTAARLGFTTTDTVNTGIEAGNSAARIGMATTETAATIPAAISKMFAALGPFGFAAVAAMLAIIASAGGKTPSVSTAGFTAADVQKTQGTGTVLGDSDATSESIKNSIEILADHSFEMLDVNQDMLRALRSVDTNIAELAGGIARGTNILGSTSSFGTVEGSTQGSTGLAAMIFGSSSSSTEVIDKGLLIKGTVQALSNIKGIIQEYETVAHTWSSSGFLGFGSDSGTDISKNIKSMSGEVPRQISKIFSGLAQSFKEGAKLLGFSAEEMSSMATIISNLPIDLQASLQGLKGSEISDALNGVFSAAFDRMIESVMPWMRDLQNVGEGLGETFARLASQMRLVDLSFKSLGMTLPTTQEIIDKYNNGMRVLGSQNDNVPVVGPTPSTAIRSSAMMEGLANAVTTNTNNLNSLIKTVAAKGSVSYIDNMVGDSGGVLTSRGLNAQETANIANYASTGEGENTLRGYGLTSGDLEALRSAADNLTTSQNALTTAQENGVNSSAALKVEWIRLQDYLIKGAGGAEAFAEKMSFVADNFLTDAQKFNIVKDTVTTAFNNTTTTTLENGDKIIGLGATLQAAGMEMPKTKAQYMELLTYAKDQLIKTGKAGANLTNQLLDLAPAADAYYTALEQQEEMLLNNKVKIAELTGDYVTQYKVTKQINETEREKIRALTASDAALTAANEQLWALEDSAALAETFGVSVSKMSDTIAKGISEGKSGAEIGRMLGEEIQQGIKSSLIQSMSTQISQVIIQAFINPMLGQLVTGSAQITAVATAGTQMSKTAAIASIKDIIDTFKKIFNDPAFKQFMTELPTMLSNALNGMDLGGVGGYISSGVSSVNDAAQNLESVFQRIRDDISSVNKSFQDLTFTTVEKQARDLADKLAEYRKELEKAGASTADTTYLINQYTEAQNRLNAAQNQKAADEKTLDIKQKIFELTHDENAIRLKALDDEASQYEKFYADLGLLTDETKALIASWKKLNYEQLQHAANTKKLQMEARIYELQGNSKAAKAISRSLELEGIEESLRPLQNYIYALEDLNDAYSAAKDAITSMRDTLDTTIKNLRNYRDSLMLGDKSILNPMDKYFEAKRQYDQILALAMSNPTDEKGKQLKQDALDKLPDISDQFLEISRTLFASSDRYTQDFTSVKLAIEQTANALDGQLSDAEKQLDELKKTASSLGIIDTTTKTIAELTQDLLDAQVAANAAKGVAAAAGSGAAGGTYTPADPYGDLITGLYDKYLQRAPDTAGMEYWKGTLTSGLYNASTIESAFKPEAYKEIINNLYSYNLGRSRDTEGFNYWYAQLMEGALSIDNIKSVFLAAAQSQGETIAHYAKGGLAHGLSLVGEEGPELVNFEKPGMVYTAGQTMNIMSDTNKELVEEIRALRAEVAKLREEQISHTGNLITSNYDSVNKMAEKLSEAVDNVTAEIAWAERSKVKVV